MVILIPRTQRPLETKFFPLSRSSASSCPVLYSRTPRTDSNPGGKIKNVKERDYFSIPKRYFVQEKRKRKIRTALHLNFLQKSCSYPFARIIFWLVLELWIGSLKQREVNSRISCLWKLCRPRRLKFFVWLCLHQFKRRFTAGPILLIISSY